MLLAPFVDERGRLRNSVHAWRRKFDAAAHHSTHDTQHHTRTYQYQQLAQNQSCTNCSTEVGGDGVLRGARVQDARLTGCTSDRFRAVSAQHSLKTYLPKRTEEGRAEQEWRVESPQPSVVHVRVSKLGEPRWCCPGAFAPRASAGVFHGLWSWCKRR